ncbi:MAG: type I secretion system permease/ATPase [Gammaproteobacteria bacterium]
MAIDRTSGSFEPALRAALGVCRGSFVYAGFFSLFVNLLMLLPAIYMLQVYDRVLTSGSESTLLMLTLIAIFLFLTMGGLDCVRGRILIATGLRLDGLLGPRVFESLFDQTLRSGGRQASTQPLNDLLTLRQFLTGPGLLAFFDAPWLPIYIAVLFLFHPVIGAVAVAAAIILFALTVWNELSTRGDLEQANEHAVQSTNHTQLNLRNAEAIVAMGMLPRIRERWQQQQESLLQLQARASRRGGLVTAMSKTFRIAVQTLILGLGAYLAIAREITPGTVIAGSILLGRALAPLDQLIAGWRGFVGARGAYGRLGELLDEASAGEPPMPLPALRGEIRVDELVVVPPGASAPVLKGISVLVEPGSSLAVIGPSAAGKTTLLRAILGLYEPRAGSVRLDGAEIGQWDRAELGRYVGYLPQDVELLDGTVGENIARFGEVDADKVVEAARAAGVHDMILRLEDGYDTRIAGNVLSAGQRQRVGLARALYGEVRVLVLDEPNSNLDQEGDAALVRTLNELRQAGRTVVLVTHRSNLLVQVDRILVLNAGEVAMLGERDQVLAQLQGGGAQQAAARPAGAPA